ncbi:alpha/beta hydrolase [Catenuloplanes japonicus]|uniref:alpha/beta hydrolase n=1 Tax=Catenuloplanes japonicus TaxID=33876 RepID=UPI001E29F118|nr:alpha/beta hydrolase [Catenuloplanes japonicus]
MLVALVATVLTVSGCSLPVFSPGGGDVSDNAATRGPGSVNLAWRNCADIPQDLFGQKAPRMRYECAEITVPKDWNNPGNGATFSLALMRVRSGQQKNRIGSLLINPGGPGGSGIDTAAYLSFGPQVQGLPSEVLERFDLVGFDPRGVSRSSPVKCISDKDLDASYGSEPDPATQAEFDELVALNKRIGDACGAKYGAELPLFSTEQAARDIDAIRAALGDEKLTYLGYSYGTLLGATYAQLFPQNIRAMVLDGAVDPQQGMVAGSESQAKGFERAFDNFSAWCARTPAQCPIGPDARGALTELLDKARATPLTGSDGREATAGWIFYSAVAALYTELYWPQLGKALGALRDGEPDEMFELADTYTSRTDRGTYDNQADALLAVNCADSDETVAPEQIRALQLEWEKTYPLFGAPLAMGMLGCAFWPGAKDPYPTGPATGAPTIVVVGTVGDPATPYEQTAVLANMLGTGQVLTWEGEGHTAYPNTQCITRAVDGYLIDLTAPERDLRCPAG